MRSLRPLVVLLALPLLFVACKDNPIPPDNELNPNIWNGVDINRSGISTVEAAASNEDADVLIVGEGTGDNSWKMLIDNRGVVQGYSIDLPRGAGAVVAHPSSGWYVAGGHDSQTETNGWIARLAADASVVWLVSTPTLSISGVAVHDDEGPVVVAQTLSNSWDVAVLHYTEEGLYDWGVEYGTDSRDDPVDICAIPGVGFLFGAYLATGDSFVGDSYLAILGPTGELLLGDMTIPEDGEQHIAGLASLGDGSVAVSGYAAGTGGELWIRLLSSSGIWLDEAHYGTSEGEDVTCIAALSSTRVITAGQADGVIDADVDMMISDHDLASPDRTSEIKGQDERHEYPKAVVRLTDTYGLVIAQAQTSGSADVEVVVFAAGDNPDEQ